MQLYARSLYRPCFPLTIPPFSESTSIPTNPRTGRAVGYAFVDLATKEEAEKAIAELSGSDLVERKVSVQLARKPTAKTEENSNEEGDNAEGQGKRGRGGARGRGRARGRGGLKVCYIQGILFCNALY